MYKETLAKYRSFNPNLCSELVFSVKTLNRDSIDDLLLQSQPHLSTECYIVEVLHRKFYNRIFLYLRLVSESDLFCVKFYMKFIMFYKLCSPFNLFKSLNLTIHFTKLVPLTLNSTQSILTGIVFGCLGRVLERSDE